MIRVHTIIDASLLLEWIMAIPNLDRHGLLSPGVHDCTLSEIEEVFTENLHRKELFINFIECLCNEIRPSFDEPIYVNGSFVTDKNHPGDIDIVLDLREASDEKKWQGLRFMMKHQNRLRNKYQVHFWINLPGNPDFSSFFSMWESKQPDPKACTPNTTKAYSG